MTNLLAIRKYLQNKTGIPLHILKENISAYKDRKKVGMHLNVSTVDIVDTGGQR